MPTVEELKCGYQLEEYLIKSREDKGYMPNLKTINGLSISVDNMEQRNKIHDAVSLMEKLNLVAGCYSIG